MRKEDPSSRPFSGLLLTAISHASVGIVLFHFLLFSCDQDTEHGEGSLEVIAVFGEGTEDAVAEERFFFFRRHLMNGDQDIITAIEGMSLRWHASRRISMSAWISSRCAAWS